MGAQTFRELEAWQLADDLRREVLAFTARLPASRDGDFCREVRDACSSVCRNLTEGFGRRRPAQFLQFVRIALGSLAEAQDQLLEARHRGYLPPAELDRLWILATRTKQTSERLRLYLERCIRTRHPR